MDSLAGVLSLLKPRNTMCGGFDVGGHWSLHFSEHDGTKGGVGWLFGLADKRIGPALSAMHGAPVHPWILQELAERVGMSRVRFAAKFKETVGATPIDYLTRWRMLLAGDRLRNSGDSISFISQSLEYESEIAFSTAFKRVMGCSPRRYSHGRKPVPASHWTIPPVLLGERTQAAQRGASRASAAAKSCKSVPESRSSGAASER